MVRRLALGICFIAIFAFHVMQTTDQLAAQEVLPILPSSDSGQILQKTQEKLNAVRSKSEALNRKAKILSKDIGDIRVSLVAKARTIQNHERRIEKIESKLKQLDTHRKNLTKHLHSKYQQIGKVLAALQRIAFNPPETLVMQAIPPADMVRTAILLRAILPRLKGKVQKFGANLAKLESTRKEARSKRNQLNTEVKHLEEQRFVMNRILGRKSTLHRRTMHQTKSAERQAKVLAKRAENIKELLSNLKKLNARQDPNREISKKANSSGALAEKKAPHKNHATIKSFEAARGEMAFPVIGRIITRFGQPISSKRVHRGLTIETSAFAQIVAPHSGKIAFAGPFRSYGQLLIIEHSGGYHSLLAGMAKIYSTVGQRVLSGEPAGVMGKTKETSINGRLHIKKPALYIEFRHKGEPMDPLAWLTVSKKKASG